MGKFGYILFLRWRFFGGFVMGREGGEEGRKVVFISLELIIAGYLI